jgi:hypothetical protein
VTADSVTQRGIDQAIERFAYAFSHTPEEMAEWEWQKETDAMARALLAASRRLQGRIDEHVKGSASA